MKTLEGSQLSEERSRRRELRRQGAVKVGSKCMSSQHKFVVDEGKHRNGSKRIEVKAFAFIIEKQQERGDAFSSKFVKQGLRRWNRRRKEGREGTVLGRSSV